jgi:hypothetical protein
MDMAIAPPRRTSRRPTLGEYVERRLGRGSWVQARNVFAKPFGARSFAAFWRYWNPVYGYVLYYYSYRPLRRVLPRPAAAWLTILLCGLLLHDLVGWLAARRVRFPEMTLLFALFGAGAIASEALRLDLSRYPFPVRALANAAWLLAAWAITASAQRYWPGIGGV